MYSCGPTCYWDWMHIVCASGGIGKFEINCFVHVLIYNGLTTLEKLDAFSQEVMSCNTARYQKLAKTFFQDRIQEKRDGHLKGFAAEVITAIAVISHNVACGPCRSAPISFPSPLPPPVGAGGRA